jgi:hypothetical protein
MSQYVTVGDEWLAANDAQCLACSHSNPLSISAAAAANSQQENAWACAEVLGKGSGGLSCWPCSEHLLVSVSDTMDSCPPKGNVLRNRRQRRSLLSCMETHCLLGLILRPVCWRQLVPAVILTVVYHMQSLGSEGA